VRKCVYIIPVHVCVHLKVYIWGAQPVYVCLYILQSACLTEYVSTCFATILTILAYSEEKAPLNSFPSSDLAELKTASSQFGYVVHTEVHAHTLP